MRVYVVSGVCGEDEERIEVGDVLHARDAAEIYATRRAFTAPETVVVRQEFPGITRWTRWRVEPVTTYRVRPA